jgi:hypothetical protein
VTASNLRPDGSRYTYLDLVQNVSDTVRDAVMRAGVAPEFSSLAGWEFDGTNTGAITDLVGIRKFR